MDPPIYVNVRAQAHCITLDGFLSACSVRVMVRALQIHRCVLIDLRPVGILQPLHRPYNLACPLAPGIVCEGIAARTMTDQPSMVVVLVNLAVFTCNEELEPSFDLNTLASLPLDKAI
jgi:hypothetical protein